MAALASSLLVGLLFGIGLTLSGMINPSRVIGFLDFAGQWDPTLAFVMAGAVAGAAPGFALARRWSKARGPALDGEPARRTGGFSAPAFAARFEIPERKDVDLPLLTGAALFGLGWGLSGLCPGPAIAGLSSGLPSILAFVVAMAGGMWIHHVTVKRVR